VVAVSLIFFTDKAEAEKLLHELKPG